MVAGIMSVWRRRDGIEGRARRDYDKIYVVAGEEGREGVR